MTSEDLIVSAEPRRAAWLIIGIGNDFRRDDGAGRVVARLVAANAPSAVRVIEESGEGAALIEAWRGAEAVILIDAVHSGAPPGFIHQFDAHAKPIPRNFFQHSSHAFSVAEAVELARELGQLPRRLIVFGIEGENYGAGEELSPVVQTAAEEVVRRILGELRAIAR
jgi:hydrogenase maturation protease